MIKTLVVVPERCTGCKICVFFCSLLKQNLLQADAARLRVLETVEKFGHGLPITCSQCAHAPCETVCTRTAIKRDRGTAALKIDKWDCVQCGLCVPACPFGMISYGNEGKVVKCDLCDGSPICAQVCPTQAILYTSMEDYTINKRRAASRDLSALSIYLEGEQ